MIFDVKRHNVYIIKTTQIQFAFHNTWDDAGSQIVPKMAQFTNAYMYMNHSASIII